MAKVLVTGGCGYIGSHTIVDLLDRGFDVISIDNLCNSDDGVLDIIEQLCGRRVVNYAIDLCDPKATARVFGAHDDITGIIHFAALKSVGESVEQPMRYIRNNMGALLNVVACALDHSVSNFIFSSSCTVYGSPDHLPVTEESPLKEAISPYGLTKQMGESVLRRAFQKSEARCISLRYFNPAGAHPSGRMGESPRNEATNLVPVITEVAIGKRKRLTVFGNDYDTRDGSCIRDYVHVMDLAAAHARALEFLLEGQGDRQFDVFNLGLGKGVSVLEAIEAFERSTGLSLNYEIGSRRPGDVDAIFANYAKAEAKLGWVPAYSIDDMMRSAWAWEQYRSQTHPIIQR